MKYSIKNTSSVGKSYEAGNGKRIHFEPGEEKELGTLPPEVENVDEEVAGWRVESVEEAKPSEDEEEEVN